MGLFSRRPDTAVTTVDPVLLEEARALLRPGFVDRTDAIETVGDRFDRADGDPMVQAAVDLARRERLAAQQTWRGPSDYDRLAAAFDRLGEQGVVARMNFTCCQNCGTDEIDDERTPARGAQPGGYQWREWAYTFFHQQDAERLADQPAVLYLSYSSFRAAAHLDPALVQAARDGDRDADRRVRIETNGAVGRIVADALRQQGLTVDWSGDPGDRIKVRITDWRKPLPS